MGDTPYILEQGNTVLVPGDSSALRHIWVHSDFDVANIFLDTLRKLKQVRREKSGLRRG